MKKIQEPTIPNFWLAAKSLVQGLQPREEPNDSMRKKKYIIIKTKVLSDIMGVVREWGVCVPLDVVSTPM